MLLKKGVISLKFAVLKELLYYSKSGVNTISGESFIKIDESDFILASLDCMLVIKNVE